MKYDSVSESANLPLSEEGVKCHITLEIIKFLIFS